MKVTNDQIKALKVDLALGKLTQKEIGMKYGLSRSTVSDIACGRLHTEIKASVKDATPAEQQVFKLRGELELMREERNAAVRELKAHAKQSGLFQAIVDEIQDRVVPFNPLPGARPVYGERQAITEDLVIHLSDGHHDQVITHADTGGLETYDFQISCCRAEQFIDTTLKWTQQTLGSQFQFPTATILAYGDFSSGEIHGAANRSYFKNMFNNTLAIGQLHAMMFRDLAPYFKQVNVIYVPGNHGRRSNKKDYHGAHDNWDYLVAKVAQLHCRDIDNLSFNIPNAFAVNVNIAGVGFQIFHGDDVKSSLGIPWYGLEKRRHRMMSLNNIHQACPIRYFCCGHFHRPGTTTEVNGEMIINGAWPATDAFAYNSLGAYTEPSQLIHGVNSKHGITWRLPVQLKCDYESEGPRRYKVLV